MIEAELSKTYPGCVVLTRARIAVRRGTVHGLVGENGAGKSTLVKILAGIIRADSGSLSVDGNSVALAGWDRTAARRARIGIVQQHGAFASTLSVVENAVLGTEGGPFLALDEPAVALANLGTAIGLPVDPRAIAGSLGLGAAQRAEIVTSLYHGAKLLILDEPTAVLAPTEVDGLLARLRALAKDGTTIIIVTHKLDEVRAVADDVTVLRAGKTVATFASAADTNAIAVAMVGAAIPEPEKLPAPDDDAREALAVALDGIELSVRAGEIVGVAGVDGNGQRELALAIAGLVPTRGSVVIGGRELASASPARRLAAGLAHIPEDRHHGGLVLDATVADNLALGRADITGRWRIDRARVARHAKDRIAQLDIRPPIADAVVRTMSGGNQQKV
ncbi:MAG TPA: ATP-binding cassette domain-containing protein, partial [Kofleriaceae bacterium]|nr:ATP-binding cassette domain-containing protein [Kofleriaceae bacterium]